MIQYIKKSFWVLVYTFLFFSPKDLVFAQAGGTTGSGQEVINNPLGPKVNSISAFINLLLDTLFPIASLLAVFFMIYAGFLMVMAGGNEEKLSKAKTAFLWTVIGIAILLGAKVLSAVICGTINQLSSTRLSCGG